MIKYIPGIEGTLSGYLTADPEMRYTAEGKAVTKLKICLSGRPVKDSLGQEIKGEDGYPQRPNIWVTASFFETLAEEVNRLLAKQNFVVMEGYLDIRGWLDSYDGLRTSYEWKPKKISWFENAMLREIIPPVEQPEERAELEA